MKKLLKKVLLCVLSLSLISSFSIKNVHAAGNVRVEAFKKPTAEPMVWPGNYNPKPGQEDGAYSSPGLYEPYYMLTDYNYAKWIRDYIAKGNELNKARGECLIELFDTNKATTLAGFVDGAKAIKRIIQFGVKEIPYLGLAAIFYDYNMCMKSKKFR